ncbi:MAG: NADH-quinone oxidoreductase subunit [Acidimicrobiaceae bacterium]|jgi:NADH-quinone oxidoreductase subunit G|nr:NADH-quinone oxidoreductase subunit [Acidimicrobiaceae bacterium]
MAESTTETVTITVDGKQVEAKPGEMIIAAAERAGVYIPRFCYHPRMRPVGMCRMCLVEVTGPRGPVLTPACFVPVADGQEIVTDSPKVKKAQDGVLEFLLINHPLDCPVCDKGGECPLQDQTLAFGPGESRFVEEKRHWEKPISLSDLVYLDRERCIQCDRCTRFADEVAGDPLIEFVGRGDHIEINTFPDQPFSSYFSGNTVQLCPVGALLAKPYRFKARPWDLEQVESTCTMCSFGCRVAVQSSANQLTRYIGIDSDPVNHGWLCDKGRFSYQWVNSEERLSAPLVRKGDELVEASWGEALAAVAKGVKGAIDVHGPSAVAVLGGARLPNEDQYAWAKLAKSVIGTDHVDAQMGDGLPASVVLGLPRATIDEACSADAVILLAPDVKEALPVLYLRLRSAAVDGRVPMVELSPRSSGLSRYCAASLGYRPGEAAAVARALVANQSPTAEVGGVSVEALTAARQAIGAAGRVVVVLGRPSLAESAESVVEAAAVLAGLPDARFLPALSRSNVLGALDMGLAPGVLPGRVDLDAGRDWWSQAGAWSSVPETAGLDAAGILRDAAVGKIQALVLLGADPATDFPDRELARQAVVGAGFVVAVDTFLNESAKQADVVLPAAGFAERPGTTTNIEGRVTRLGQKIVPPGTAWPDWMIAVELAARLGGDLGVETVEGLWDEVVQFAPSHAGASRAVLADRAHRDGLVLPLPFAAPAEPAEPMDPTAAPGIAAVEAPEAPPADFSTAPAAVEKMERLGMIEFRAPADAAPLPQLDSYALRLVVTKPLYDDGTLVQHSPALAALAREPRVRANHYDLDRLGLGTGGRVRVQSPRTGFVAEAEVDDGVPRGSVALTFGEHAGALIDVSQPVIDVRLETP